MLQQQCPHRGQEDGNRCDHSQKGFFHIRGQVRWIEGTRMISDSLTKKMGSHFLRKVMSTGTWSLSEIGFREEQDALLLLVSTDKSLAGVNPSPVPSE